LARGENPETDVAPDRIDAARQAGDRDDSRTDVAPDRIDADRQERDRDANSTVCGLPSKEE